MKHAKRRAQANRVQKPQAKLRSTASKAQTKPSKSKSNGSNPQHSAPTIPFGAFDKLLLVGDGDLSFAASISHNHECEQLTATVYDSHVVTLEKYPQAEGHAETVEQDARGGVLYGVDATKLHSNTHLRKDKFDVIMFNFPHVGGKSTDVNRQVRYNQELLVAFFESAIQVLGDRGTMVVTLFEGEPYTLWNIRDLARHSGLQVQRSFRFQAEAYPGYSHARTLGNIDGGGGWKGEERLARSYIFEHKDSADTSLKGKKRATDADSSDDGD